MTIETSKFKRTDATYLQGFGYTTGTPAGDLKAGDTMVWNNGGTSKVHAITKETTAFVWIDEVSIQSGKEVHYERKLKKNRIVARPVSELNR
jgi:hypothetical protein